MVIKLRELSQTKAMKFMMHEQLFQDESDNRIGPEEKSGAIK